MPAVPQWAPLVFDEDTGAHWRPALRGAYALISFAGQEPCTPVDDPVTEADFAYQVLDPASPTSIARLSPFWRDVWEDGRAAWTVQCGLYTVTPDHRPLIDETPVPGLYVNTGYSGHGVMCSVGGGRLLVERLQGGATRSPWTVVRRTQMEDPMIGCFVQTPRRAVAQVLAASGVELLIADGEHAPLSPADIEEIVVGGDLAGVPVLARVPFSAGRGAARARQRRRGGADPAR